MINPESRATYRTRSRIVRSIRHFLDDQNFMEVEGPTLQVVPGGTEAKPFKTFHNALWPRILDADQPGAVPEAADGGWIRAGL